MSKPNSVQWFLDKLIEHRIIIVGQTTYGDKVKPKHEILFERAKAMHKEETEAKYQEGREIGKIEVLTSQSTKNASEYSQGYNKGFLAALEYMNSTIENKIKLRQYEQQ